MKTKSSRCECGGEIVLATIQITNGGQRYPLRDRETGEQLLACAMCGRVVSETEVAEGGAA